MCLGFSCDVKVTDGKVYRNFKKKVCKQGESIKIHSPRNVYKVSFVDPNLLSVESKKNDPDKMKNDLLGYLNDTLGLRAKKKHLQVLDLKT